MDRNMQHGYATCESSKICSTAMQHERAEWTSSMDIVQRADAGDMAMAMQLSERNENLASFCQ
jgi:hypothetical protein